MGGFSWWHWLIVLAVVLLLFGGKKIPELMKGLGTGIKSFKKAVKEDDEQEEQAVQPMQTIEIQESELAPNNTAKAISETTKKSPPKKTTTQKVAPKKAESKKAE